jgi:hypothetical protein
MIEADQFHREHAVVKLAIRDIKEGAGLEHIPSGHYSASPGATEPAHTTESVL